MLNCKVAENLKLRDVDPLKVGRPGNLAQFAPVEVKVCKREVEKIPPALVKSQTSPSRSVPCRAKHVSGGLLNSMGNLTS